MTWNSDKYAGRWSELEEFYNYQPDENKSMMEGKKTYAFLLVAFLGWLGVGDWVTEGDAGNIIDAVLNLVGIIGAIWGRAVARV